MILARKASNRQPQEEIKLKLHRLRTELNTRFQSAKVELSSFVTGLCSELKAVRHYAITGFLAWIVGLNTGTLEHNSDKKRQFISDVLPKAITTLRDGMQLQVAVSYIQENLEQFWGITVSHRTIRRDLLEMEVMGLFTREAGLMIFGKKGVPTHLEKICIEKILAYGNLLECRLHREGWQFRTYDPGNSEYVLEADFEAKLFPSHNNSTLYNLATKVFGFIWRRIDPMMGEDSPSQSEAFAEVEWMPEPEEPSDRPWQEIVAENKAKFMSLIDWASRTFYRHLGKRIPKKPRDPNFEIKKPSIEDTDWLSLSREELLPGVQLDRPVIKVPVEQPEYEVVPTPEPTLEEMVQKQKEILEHHRRFYKKQPWLIRRMEESFKRVQEKLESRLKQDVGRFDMETALGF